MKTLRLFVVKKTYWVLLLMVLLALFLRWLYLPKNAVSFAYDQARDAFIVQQMLHGNLKVLGPPVSGVPGLFHGVLYYYVIAPAYFLGHGNPIFVAYFQSFIASLVVFAVYFLGYLLTKNRASALLSALFFAFSFEATQYANLLVNVTMGVWFVPVFYIGLYLWITKSWKYAPILTGLSFGLAIQSEVALVYHAIPLAFWIVAFRRKIDRNQIFFFLISFILSVSSMIVSEIKFGFSGIKGAGYILSGSDQIVQSRNLSDYVVTILNQSAKTFAYTIFPLNVVFGGLLGFLITYFSLKTKEFWAKFLSTYIFAYALAIPFGGSNIRHILVGVAPAVAVLLGTFLWKYLRGYKMALFIAVAIILFSNLTKIFIENKNGQTIFPLQPDLVLSNEIRAVDYTYKTSAGKPFSISTLTNPLFVNTLWSYLYNWYGEPKYGYLPNWVGHDQVGQLGDDLSFAPSNVSEHFFIIEPTYGIPDIWITYAKGDQNSMSRLVNQTSFGQLIVESRLMNNENK